MANNRNLSILAQGASTAGILAGTYGGTGASLSPTTAGNTIFTTDGSTWSSTQKIVRGTSVATTSGTAIDFTGIPSWVKRITVMLNGVSTNGTAYVIVQIGSTTFTTTGYSTTIAGIGFNIYPYIANLTNGFGTTYANGAVDARIGAIDLINHSGNLWIGTSLVSLSVGTFMGLSSGSVTLGGVLDRVRLTTSNGTDTFDAGSVNILYE